MKPLLYAADTSNFDTLGLGVLSECVSCKVTEELNGVFECNFTYPMSGRLFSELTNDRYIKIDASYELKGQLFKIVKISKPFKGVVSVYCQHCSYLASQLQITPTFSVKNATVEEALEAWKNNLIGVGANRFSVGSDTDLTSVHSADFSIDMFENAREALGGAEGSILDHWHGEYRFNNYIVSMLRKRGENRGVYIRYGKNMTDFKQEESISDTYTSVYPYAVVKNNNTDRVYTMDYPYYIDSEYASAYDTRRILRVDFSDDIDDEASSSSIKESLKQMAQQYITNNDVGIPKVSMSLSYVDLAKSLNIGELGEFEKIYLGDTVGVYYERLGINTTARVRKIVWDALRDRIESIDVGDAVYSLSDTISGIQKNIVTKTQLKTEVADTLATAGAGILKKGVINGLSFIMDIDSGDIKFGMRNDEGLIENPVLVYDPYTLRLSVVTIDGINSISLADGSVIMTNGTDKYQLVQNEDGDLTLKNGDAELLIVASDKVTINADVDVNGVIRCYPAGEI